MTRIYAKLAAAAAAWTVCASTASSPCGSSSCVDGLKLQLSSRLSMSDIERSMRMGHVIKEKSKTYGNREVKFTAQYLETKFSEPVWVITKGEGVDVSKLRLWPHVKVPLTWTIRTIAPGIKEREFFTLEEVKEAAENAVFYWMSNLDENPEWNIRQLLKEVQQFVKEDMDELKPIAKERYLRFKNINDRFESRKARDNLVGLAYPVFRHV